MMFSLVYRAGKLAYNIREQAVEAAKLLIWRESLCRGKKALTQRWLQRNSRRIQKKNKGE